MPARLNLLTADTASRLRELLAEGSALLSRPAPGRSAAVDEPPPPLELRAMPAATPGDDPVVAVWLGPGMQAVDGAVRVNGAAVQARAAGFGAYQSPALPDLSPGWYAPATPIPATAGTRVWLVWRRSGSSPAAPAGHSGGLAWELSSSPSSDWGSLYAHAVLLGWVSPGGAIVQCALGAVDVSVWLPDSAAIPSTPSRYDPADQSLDLLSSGVAQLHDFVDPTLLPAADIGQGSTAGGTDAAQIVFRVPHTGGAGAHVAYGTLQALAQAMVDRQYIHDGCSPTVTPGQTPSDHGTVACTITPCGGGSPITVYNGKNASAPSGWSGNLATIYFADIGGGYLRAYRRILTVTNGVITSVSPQPGTNTDVINVAQIVTCT